MTTSRWVLAAVMLGGCAGASELGDRVARLEARVYGVPGPTTEPIPWEAGAAVGVSDAGTGRGPDAMPHRTLTPFRPHLVDSGGPSAATVRRRCLERAELECKWTVVDERSPSGLKWQRQVAHAKSSAAFKSCFGKRSKSCDAPRASRKRRERFFAKLDSELTPQSIDKAFTAKLERVLTTLPDAGSVQVACNQRFCRVRGAPPHDHQWKAALAIMRGERIDAGMPPHIIYNRSADFAGALYLTRDGYIWPSLP